jgi:hypothetical protein
MVKMSRSLACNQQVAIRVEQPFLYPIGVMGKNQVLTDGTPSADLIPDCRDAFSTVQPQGADGISI